MGVNNTKFYKKFHKRTQQPEHLGKSETYPNKKEEEFRFEDGRRFHNDKNAKYFLPNDDDEIDRLHSQHFLLRYLWQSNYLAPIDDLLQDEKSKILDLGCGGGSWLFDMATDFRKPSFIGVDISPTVPQGIKPRNVEFVQKNILDGLPFKDNSFDYVHQRSLITGIPSDKWQSVIDEIVRVLKPGGYLELYEFSLKYQNLGPSSQIVANALIQFMLDKGQEIQVNDKLQSFLEVNGQVEDIVRKDLILPYGKSSGRIGELAVENHTYAISFLRHLLSKILNITPEGYDKLIDDMRKEMHEYETFTQTIRVYGRKKL